ncbi:pentatricopeptide repeat-containing protein At5g16860-like [Papaver somniferum]|uniref:pentatricopeptide repeat-containing protein At5g16860-like n=1 Tax=Papaver somniferum TaxID=3469 RepID=UPI000E6F47E1|nr:pentatricopeptide repeat-containing protein At5g16860-like [Papaver somniferum]
MAKQIAYRLLKECTSLRNAKLLHQQTLIRGTSKQMAIDIISMYLSCECPSYALTVLEHLQPSPSLVYWWNVLIKKDVHIGLFNDSLSLFSRMTGMGWTADHYTYPFVLKACGEIPDTRRGRIVHAVICNNGFESNVFVCNSLVAMYARCGALEDARKMFDEMCQRGVTDKVSWNSIVAAYMQSGDSDEALMLFMRMTTSVKLLPDVVSLVNILPTFGSGGALEHGRQVHGLAVRSGLFDDVFVGNAILNMYAKCKMMDHAKKVFDVMEDKDVVTWNAMVTAYSQSGSFKDVLLLVEKMKEKRIEMDVVTWSAVIAGYAQRGHGCEALDVFRQMQISGSVPNVVTLISLLSGCATAGALLQGKETHCYSMKCILKREGVGHEEDKMVNNALIDMYAKCHDVSSARCIFDSLTFIERNVVTWTAMIGGYAQQGDANDSVKVFSEMMRGSSTPNAFTISCVLMACSRLSALRSGKEIHAYALRNRYENSMLHVANCLIDMYSKCGDVDAARNVFDNMKQRNDVSWISLMTGYGMHGRGEDALEYFDGMLKAGFVPEGLTFVVVLYACSHSGMVDQAINYFNNMTKDFGVIPQVEHYACMVDVLGRAGRLNEAVELINRMPVEPSQIVWVALLSACKTHTNVELGELASKKLLEMDSENDGSYTLLSNIYADAGCWNDVARIRSLMKKSGIRKRPGYSYVQGKKGNTTFFVGDRSHPQSEQIYKVLADLILRIKELGYIPKTRYALHDVADEEKNDLLSEHSEKLALAYGILTSYPGAPIRIIKNLRICGDCHSAITFISKIVDHEIIVRDPSRFHHFKKGSCSCKGYW